MLNFQNWDHMIFHSEDLRSVDISIFNADRNLNYEIVNRMLYQVGITNHMVHVYDFKFAKYNRDYVKWFYNYRFDKEILSYFHQLHKFY